MSLIFPDEIFGKLSDIKAEDLRRYGIEGIALDADNTTVRDHTDIVLEGVNEWIEKMRSDGFSVILLSNGKQERAGRIAGKLGINAVARAKKPLISGYIRACAKMKTAPRSTVMIGDQVFTDVIGAKRAGCKSFYVYPDAPEQRNRYIYIAKRLLEKPILRAGHRKCRKKNSDEN